VITDEIWIAPVKNLISAQKQFYDGQKVGMPGRKHVSFDSTTEPSGLEEVSHEEYCKLCQRELKIKVWWFPTRGNYCSCLNPFCQAKKFKFSNQLFHGF